MALTWSQLYNVIDAAAHNENVNLTPQQMVALASISTAESGRNPSAVGSGVDHSLGLFQVNPVAHPQYNPQLLVTDPVYNAEAALQISNNATDFTPWTTARNGMAEANTLAASSAYIGSNPNQATLASFGNSSNSGGILGELNKEASSILGRSGFGEAGKVGVKAANTVKAAVSTGKFLSDALTHIDMIAQILIGTVVLLAGIALLASGQLSKAVTTANQTSSSTETSPTKAAESEAEEAAVAV
jgi:hypothetical protein